MWEFGLLFHPENDFWVGNVIPHGEQVATNLQHHILVQVSLGRVQLLPLLPAEVYGHILN